MYGDKDMTKYRIVYNPDLDVGTCVWQLQVRKRHYLFFWRWVECANFSSADAAAKEILIRMNQ